MGKKSLTKSTTKKKTPAKKKTGAAQKTKSAARKPTLKSILKRSYDTWSPEPLFSVEPDPDYLDNFAAPPAVEEKDPKKAEQIRALLARKFDPRLLNAVKAKSEEKAEKKKSEPPKAEPAENKPAAKAKAPAPAPKPAPRKNISVAELLKQQYDAWQPAKLFTPASSDDAIKNYAAPPVIEAGNADEISRVKGLLSRQFDLTAPEIVAPPDPERLEAEPVPMGTPVQEAPEPAPEGKTAKPETAPAVADPEMSGVTATPPEAAPEVEAAAATEEIAQPADQPTAEAANQSAEAAEAKPEADEKPVTPEPEIKAEAAPAPAEQPQPEATGVTANPPEPEPKVEAAATTEAIAPAAAQEKKAEEKPPVKAEKKAPEPKKEMPPPKPAPPEKDSGGPVVPPPPPPPTRPSEPPLSGPMMFLVGCLAVIFGILLIASGMNTSKYYMKQKGDDLEIWQGTFSPDGRKLLMTVPDAKAPETEKEVYSKKEALTPIFNFYMLKASERSQEKGVLDLEDIRETLDEARSYAVTSAQKQRVDSRLNQLQYMSLLYKAEMAGDEKTLAGFDRALLLLNQATSLKYIEASEKDLAQKKMAQVRQARTALEAKEKAAKEAAEKAAAQKKADAQKPVKGVEPKKDQPAAGNSAIQAPPAKTVIQKPPAEDAHKTAEQPQSGH